MGHLIFTNKYSATFIILVTQINLVPIIQFRDVHRASITYKVKIERIIKFVTKIPY